MLDFNRKIILYLHRSSWPRGQAVKTPPFHGGIMGSNPVGVTKKNTLFGVFFIAPTAFAPQTVPSALIRTQVGCVTLTLASKFALLAITGSYTLHNSYLKLKSYFYNISFLFYTPYQKIYWLK